VHPLLGPALTSVKLNPAVLASGGPPASHHLALRPPVVIPLAEERAQVSAQKLLSVNDISPKAMGIAYSYAVDHQPKFSDANPSNHP
jgi:hypothetical protein